MNKNAYRSQVIKYLSIEPDIGTKALNVGSVHHSDTVNLADDRPELLFGPEVDGQTDNGIVAPFYISLNIHDLILHNAMLDLRCLSQPNAQSHDGKVGTRGHQTLQRFAFF
jgi:hypothetical protein